MAAVDLGRVSTVIGYQITEKNFATSSPNLPQRIAVLCEANESHQATLDTNEWQATSLQAVGIKYGYGSPAYHIARILLSRIGSIPLVFYPQAQAGGASATTWGISPTGVATENATHTLYIAGRGGVDGSFYSFAVAKGDTASQINAKITDAVSNVLGAPVSAEDTDYDVLLTTKWKGATSNGFTVRIDTNGKDAGIEYEVEKLSSGAGTPAIAAALDVMKSKWNTIVINSYGLNSNIMEALEQLNGIPDPNNPTGQYTGIIMRPFIAFTGDVSEDPSVITDARAAQVTIAVCPAPKSEAFQFEAAANMAAVYAQIAQNTPQLDAINGFYPDMPVNETESIGDMSNYEDRDRIVKLGCSTVDLVNGRYQVKDFITTYHPEGNLNPLYRYVRDLMVIFNIKFGYFLIIQENVIGSVICADDDIVSASKIIKPKIMKGLVIGYLADLIDRALVVDLDFSLETLAVAINSSNPNRLDVNFRTKLSGIARISATNNEVGFNFGSTNS